MKNSIKIIFGVLGIIIIVLIGMKISGNIVSNTEQEKVNELAKCLTNSGAKMYGASWCGHCNNQKKMFGSGWKYVSYVECSDSNGMQTQECKLAQIEAYPTWVFGDGTRVMGELSFKELAMRSRCSFD